MPINKQASPDIAVNQVIHSSSSQRSAYNHVTVDS
jgi:hypothetical protein